MLISLDYIWSILNYEAGWIAASRLQPCLAQINSCEFVICQSGNLLVYASTGNVRGIWLPAEFCVAVLGWRPVK